MKISMIGHVHNEVDAIAYTRRFVRIVALVILIKKNNFKKIKHLIVV